MLHRNFNIALIANKLKRKSGPAASGPCCLLLLVWRDYICLGLVEWNQCDTALKATMLKQVTPCTCRRQFSTPFKHCVCCTGCKVISDICSIVCDDVPTWSVSTTT